MKESAFDRDLALVRGNLRLLDAETASAAERRIALLYDIASLIARDSSLIGADDRSEHFARFIERGVIPELAADDAKPYLGAYYTSQLLSDRITICRFLAKRLGWRSDFSLAALLGEESGRFEPISASDGASPKIAYLRNSYADSAFRIFSEVIGNASVTYPGDFAAVCEEVYYGRADMCILPLDSSRDAKLISFSRLIDKYELKIILTCDVSSPDGSVTTRYALLRRSLAFPEKLDEHTERYLEVSFVPDETTALADVLLAAEDFGLKLYKVDAIPLTYSDSDFSYDVILHCPDRAVEPFALFMALAAPQFETIGIYAHIKE